MRLKSFTHLDEATDSSIPLVEFVRPPTDPERERMEKTACRINE